MRVTVFFRSLDCSNNFPHPVQFKGFISVPNKHNLVGPRPVSYRRGGIISASYYCNGPAAGRCSSNLGIRVTRGSPPAASRSQPVEYSLGIR